MRKEELRKLRSLPATAAIIREGKFDVERNSRYGYTYQRSWKEPKWKILCRAQQLGGYIKVALFLPQDLRKGIKTPRYEIFLDTLAEEYITRELDDKGKEVRWLSAMIGNLDGVDMYCYGYDRNQQHYLTQDTARTLNHQLKIKGEPEEINGKPNTRFRLREGLYRLRKWQQDIKDEETRRREEKEVAPWDKDMALIPEFPKSFEEWMRRNACKDVYIFYEYVRGGATKGFCSRCKTDVTISNPKHNEPTACPHCKAKALFKSAKKCQTLSTDTYFGQIIQKIDGGIVVRQFTQDQHYRNHTVQKPYIRTLEYKRIIIPDKGNVREYVWGLYKNKKTRWNLSCSSGYFAGYYDRQTMPLYKRNFAAVKNSKLFRQSAISLWPELPMSVTEYLKMEKGNPAVEMLAKIGMFKLAKGLIRESYDKDLLKQDETEIAKLLKIDNSRLKRLRRMNGDVKHLRWMQLEKFYNTIWPDEMIKGLGDAGLISSDFGFLNPPISYMKVYNYLLKQSALMSNEKLYQVMITWRDYHNMADQLKMNTKLEQIARPKDLKAAHDEAILLKEADGIKKQAADLRKKWTKAEKHLEHLQKFEYKSEKYQIVAPKKLEDIVKEGVILKHCVHTCDYYFSRIQTDESYLFFLRKTSCPDTPWYTLEVEPSGNIRQKRTTGDNQNKDFEDAIEFLKEWQKYFAKQLTKKEKKLGEKADELRRQNYSNLRKNQNRVWHGKLAGQLLADVLEADFMAVAGGI